MSIVPARLSAINTTQISKFNPVRQLGRTRYALLAVAVVAQIATVLITWPLWQVRDSGLPHLPVLELPQFSFAGLMIVASLIVVVFPRPGVWIHLAVLTIASLFDQMRLQPQFAANWLLMLAVVYHPTGRQFARLFLASLWFWAGMHKMLSPDWWTHVSYGLSADAGLDPEWAAIPFGLVVASSELGLGILAWFKPRWAAIGCPLLHVGIVIFLSPLFRDWNYSVFPWNLATAIVGCWILLNAKTPRQSESWEKKTLAVLMVLPIGFYLGLIDHVYAHVLYSKHIPKAAITNADGKHHSIEGWGDLNVPFPNERRTLKQFFEKTATAGAKLHIHDPRRLLDDQYWKMTSHGAKQIDETEFYQPTDGGVIGVGVAHESAVFRLWRSGVRILKRTEDAPIYAIEIRPDQYSPQMLELAAELPNLEQIQLGGTDVQDEHLRPLKKLRRLEGIGINNTPITFRGNAFLESMPSMKIIESDLPDQ